MLMGARSGPRASIIQQMCLVNIQLILFFLTVTLPLVGGAGRRDAR